MKVSLLGEKVSTLNFPFCRLFCSRYVLTYMTLVKVVRTLDKLQDLIFVISNPIFMTERPCVLENQKQVVKHAVCFGENEQFILCIKYLYTHLKLSGERVHPRCS